MTRIQQQIPSVPNPTLASVLIKRSTYNQPMKFRLKALSNLCHRPILLTASVRNQWNTCNSITAGVRCMYVHACIQVPCSRALITSLSIYSSENASANSHVPPHARQDSCHPTCTRRMTFISMRYAHYALSASPILKVRHFSNPCDNPLHTRCSAVAVNHVSSRGSKACIRKTTLR